MIKINKVKKFLLFVGLITVFSAYIAFFGISICAFKHHFICNVNFNHFDEGMIEMWILLVTLPFCFYLYWWNTRRIKELKC